MSYELTWSYVTYTSWLRRPAETFQRCSASDWCCEIHHIIRQWYQLQKSSCIFASGLRNDEQKQCKWELDKIVIGCLTDFFVCFLSLCTVWNISIQFSFPFRIQSNQNQTHIFVWSRHESLLPFVSQEFRPMHILGNLEERVDERLVSQCVALRKQTLGRLERLEQNYGFLAQCIFLYVSLHVGLGSRTQSCTMYCSQSEIWKSEIHSQHGTQGERGHYIYHRSLVTVLGFLRYNAGGVGIWEVQSRAWVVQRVYGPAVRAKCFQSTGQMLWMWITSFTQGPLMRSVCSCKIAYCMCAWYLAYILGIHTWHIYDWKLNPKEF